MGSIDFKNKMSVNRPFSRFYKKSIDSSRFIRTMMEQLESDRGRIINSAAVRRLQQKTQVFPLEKNSAVRSRLTHSLEVQQTGRYLVKSIFQKLDENKIEQYGLEGLERPIETIVEMACLMHDVGNPPFGHFGEYAINKWFDEHVDNIFLDYKNSELAQQLRYELKEFEGNAQAIRLITHVISLNLTYVQMASLIKYIKPAFSEDSYENHELSYLYKKSGYFWSEREIVDRINDELLLNKVRHPFVYIMEAADDISYCLADIEDAVEKGILDITKLTELFINYVNSDETIEVYQNYNWCKKSIKDTLDFIVENRYDHMDEVGSFFVQFRSTFVQVLVNYGAEQFIKNIETIYQGTLNSALMDMGGIASDITKALKKIAVKYVFNNSEVRTLELKGYQIITGLLDCYFPILMANYDDFSSIVDKIVGNDNDIKIKTKNKLLVHLVHRLAKKHVKSYDKAIKEMQKEDDNCFGVKELYYRCRLIQDYISGMTDQFAFDEYQELKVLGLC